MAALKPRIGTGPMELQRDRSDILVYIPLDSGTERLVFALTEAEARDLARTLTTQDEPRARA